MSYEQDWAVLEAVVDGELSREKDGSFDFDSELGTSATDAATAILCSQPQFTVPCTLGPYCVMKHLATGGMGEVYEADDPRLKQFPEFLQMPVGSLGFASTPPRTLVSEPIFKCQRHNLSNAISRLGARLAQRRFGAPIPVILMSGNSVTSPLIKGPVNGKLENCHFLAKPFVPARLLETVEEVLLPTRL